MGIFARLSTQFHRATRTLPHFLFKLVDGRFGGCGPVIYLFDSIRQVERVE